MDNKPRRRKDGAILHRGDCLIQEEFHRLYSAMPSNYRAELLGGIVYEPSPLGLEHSDIDTLLSAALLDYASHTPGLQVGGNVSVILSNLDEVQPDLALRIRPEYGGQSRNTQRKRKKGAIYVEGAPELVCEVSFSSQEIDLHIKKERYATFGVQEYIVVVCQYPQKLHWFNLQTRKNLESNSKGIFRSEVFPGLWIDSKALLELDYLRVMSVIRSGMKSAKYATFASRLAKAKR